MREMTEIKQQDHGDVFYHKRLRTTMAFFLNIPFCFLLGRNLLVLKNHLLADETSKKTT